MFDKHTFLLIMKKRTSLAGIVCFLLLSFTAHTQEITVEKIWSQYQFITRGVPGFNGMNDGLHYTQVKQENGHTVILREPYSGKEKSMEIFSTEGLMANDMPIEMDEFYFNNDESKLLIATETTPVYRRSYRAIFYLYDLKTKKFQPLDEQHQPQTLAEYSPDGTKVAYVHKNNLYYKDIASGKVTQVTSDGEFNQVINGTTDWVYEEEFAITKGFGWSPDSKHISFLKFNESEVRDYTLTYYQDLYPDLYTFKYPKAGEDNSKVSCHIYTLDGAGTQQIDLGEYEYIPRLKWSAKENNLVLQTLNRHQNHVKYHLVKRENGTWSDRVFYEEEDRAYIDIDDNLLILSDGKTILRTSEKDGRNHIYALGFDGKIRQLTQGEWDVIEFLGIDEQSGQVYYTAAVKGAVHKGIYAIDLQGKKTKALSSEEGYNEATFSNGMKYFIKSYSNANTPPVYTLCDAKNGKEIRVLEDNAALVKRLSEYKLGRKELIQVKGAEGMLNAWILKPANFDASKKYPVYINIYGGPGSNMVADRWGGMDYMYHQLLAQKGYIVVSVDPRGTMYRGAAFKKSTYMQLGKLETEDFVAVAKELGTWDYIDKERIGIQGWSYGGFMTSLAMTKGNGVFKMGIAVAPVTNWRYYDNIYTERFMRTPEENPDGYDRNSPINFVEDLQGKYLLIHGSGDDNVHYQNTMEMITALVAADKQFDLFIYPNKNHGIYGGNTRNHLFTMMLNYTLENL